MARVVSTVPVHQVKRTKGCLIIGLYLTSFCTPDYSVYIKPHSPILIHDKSVNDVSNPSTVACGIQLASPTKL